MTDSCVTFLPPLVLKDRYGVTRREAWEAGAGWSEADDRTIYAGYIMAEPFKDMALKCGRSATGVRQRLKRLGLMDEAGHRVIEPPSFESILARRRAEELTEQRGAQEEQHA